MYKILGKEEGQGLINEMDHYLETMSTSVMMAKMNSNNMVELSEFRRYLVESVCDFTNEETQKNKKCLDRMNTELTDFGLRNQMHINIVKTNGKDEWNSAYTRGNTIYLPIKKLQSYGVNELYDLLLHEYFHVYSRMNSQIRRELYELLGFKKCDSKLIPEKVRKYLIFNPDAMEIVVTTIEHEKNKIKVIPLIVMDEIEIDSSKDITASIHMKVYIPEFVQLEDMKRYDELENQLMVNTDFAQHPEETLAENFVLVINKAKKGEHQDFLERMAKVLMV